MAQQELDEGHVNPGAPVVVPAQGPPAGAVLPAPLAQLVEVLRANFHDPLTVSPQNFLTTVFEADLAQHEQAEIDLVKPHVRRAVQALVIASTTRHVSKQVWNALSYTLEVTGVALPELADGSPPAAAANSAPVAKKSEFHLSALLASSLVDETHNSLGALRASAASLKRTKGFGLNAVAVAAFAKLQWTAWYGDAQRAATLLDAVMEGIRSEHQLDEVTLLCLSWSALAEFLSEVAPSSLAGGDTADAFMVTVERNVIHPLLAEGCAPLEVVEVLEEHVLAPVANRLLAISETANAAVFNVWTETREGMDAVAICQSVKERRRSNGKGAALGAKVLPASILAALHKAAEVLMGGVVPPAWRTNCTAARACPLHTLVPELCPYGDAGCPGVHLQESERQEIIMKAFGDRNPSVINMWERATRAGELARHKLSRPGTYVPADTPISPPTQPSGKKGARQ
jgi:hypothetical protein